MPWPLLVSARRLRARLAQVPQPRRSAWAPQRSLSGTSVGMLHTPVLTLRLQRLSSARVYPPCSVTRSPRSIGLGTVRRITFRIARTTDMRTFSGVLLCWLVSSVVVFGASSTNEWSLFKHQGRHQAYEWRISEARIASTPRWDIDTAKIPVTPDKAWRIAKDWFKKQNQEHPAFVKMEVRPFVLDNELSPETRSRLKDVLGRYYYRIECIPAAFDSMVVVVLMDGSVLEPVPIPDLALEWLK